ncbi:MAG: hypothetical protein U0452_00045 [Anaerolineae bacterium]
MDSLSAAGLREYGLVQEFLKMCADAFNRLVGLWETADEEGRQILARGLFEEIVFDLDSQMMVGFQAETVGGPVSDGARRAV